jgi:hypothetical protein
LTALVTSSLRIRPNSTACLHAQGAAVSSTLDHDWPAVRHFSEIVTQFADIGRAVQGYVLIARPEAPMQARHHLHLLELAPLVSERSRCPTASGAAALILRIDVSGAVSFTARRVEEQVGLVRIVIDTSSHPTKAAHDHAGCVWQTAAHIPDRPRRHTPNHSASARLSRQGSEPISIISVNQVRQHQAATVWPPESRVPVGTIMIVSSRRLAPERPFLPQGCLDQPTRRLPTVKPDHVQRSGPSTKRDLTACCVSAHCHATTNCRQPSSGHSRSPTTRSLRRGSPTPSASDLNPPGRALVLYGPACSIGLSS